MQQGQQVISSASFSNPFVPFDWAFPPKEQRVSRRRGHLISRFLRLPFVAAPVSDVVLQQTTNSNSPNAPELIGQREKPFRVSNQVAGLRSILDNFSNGAPQGRRRRRDA